MKQKTRCLAILLAAVLLCAGAGTMTAEAAVPGTNIGGYWDLSFGDKNGWLILSEHPRGGFWGGELYIYRAKKHHDKSIADWHCPVSASFVQNGASTLIQDLQGTCAVLRAERDRLAEENRALLEMLQRTRLSGDRQNNP